MLFRSWHCRHSAAIRSPLAVQTPRSLPARTEPELTAPSTRTPLSSLLPHDVLSAYKNPGRNPSHRDPRLQPLESLPRAVVDFVRFASSSASSPRKESGQDPLHRAHRRRLLLRPRRASSLILAAAIAHFPCQAQARIEGERAIIPMPFSPSFASEIISSP